MAERFGCELLLNSDASSSADFESPDVTQALRKAAALGAGLDAEAFAPSCDRKETCTETAALIERIGFNMM